MKKFIVPVLLMLLLVPAFAQEDGEEREPGWTFTGEAAVVADLLYLSGISGNDGEDDWGSNLKGSFNVLNSSTGGGSSLGIGSSLFIKGYEDTGDYGYDVQLQLKVGMFSERGEDLFNGDGFTIGDILFNVGDWFLKGYAGMFEGYIGNTGYGGFVSAYGDNITDWTNFYLDGFYVNMLGNHVGTNNMNAGGASSALALGVNFTDSLRFAIGTDFGTHKYFDKAAASAAAVDARAMFSAKQLAGLVDLDVFYGINGNDDDTTTRGSGGVYHNLFGVYAGFKFGDLGLSVGYSGLATVNEPQQDPDPSAGKSDTINTINPLFSSVHVHVNIPISSAIGITFNNNVSFAGVNSKEYEKGADYLTGLYAGATLMNSDDKYKESWFGWDAAVAVKYGVTDALALYLQLTNQLAVMTTDYDGKEVSTTTTDTFYAALNAEYTKGKVTFGAGLTFGLAGITEDVKSDNKDNEGTTSVNFVKFGIPLFFKVAF